MTRSRVLSRLASPVKHGELARRVKNVQMFAHYNCKAVYRHMHMHVNTNDFEAEEDGREKIKVLSVPFAAFFGHKETLLRNIPGKT